MTDQPRYIVLGTGGLFTRSVLQTLLDSDALPMGYLQAGPELTEEPGRFCGIRVETRAANDDPIPRLQQLGVQCRFDTQHQIDQLAAAFEADFLLVACWPTLLSAAVIDSVTCAALNLHPSLLPAYRGSDPVTAQLAAQNHRFGVTLHLLSDEFDCGDIVFQQTVKIAAPLDAATVLRSTAEVGARLFIEAAHSFSDPGWRPVKQQ